MHTDSHDLKCTAIQVFLPLIHTFTTHTLLVEMGFYKLILKYEQIQSQRPLRIRPRADAEGRVQKWIIVNPPPPYPIGSGVQGTKVGLDPYVWGQGLRFKGRFKKS